ncbi:Dolichyl-phosphate-mannose--protein mannosyltransferase 1 [Hypsizygus marmoreus]|uniref:dolichyl-phosphate-mannose--protein mannosyltransferase n=1 Tax=Hypsizygus marmoreus TaxID=39966 RepID=A0A369JDW7_HYPMA|nr:Dolichyl-phosphate-mannose--protein mannosyltransferase 1 [Hypsizygus marmoreus]
MSGHVRARRPASPPPGVAHPAPAPAPSQRFPHPRDEHLDADERRAAASKGFAPLGRGKYHPPGGLNMTVGEWKLLFFIVLVAAGVRLFRLSKPNSVVFDEVHFGKFASKYIKTQYFVDVHPPLAKLLITLAAFVFGYDGQFDFKDIGKIYERVPYVAMRMVPASLGVATVPLAYLTLRALDCRATTALLASLFITFENGLVTQSRHILLDSPLIFFTALTVFLWCGFYNEDKHEPFTASWWTWLTLTGLSLGAVVSCKWVGLFTIATIGVSTLHQLWNLLGDLRVPPRLFVRHFMARALCLIVVPIVFYMAMFQIHFLILENSGDGDGFMSSEFQHTLGGRGMADTFADVGVGSQVTIRHVNTQGGYLHSHAHTYPGGSKQQQITLYPHRDSNNDWRIYNASDDTGAFDWKTEPLSYITAGTRIKLTHVVTDKHLHSHDIRPPVSDVDFQNEVSAYGMPGFSGDANDDWYVEIEHGDKRDKESTKRLRTLRTVFRLRHALTGCYLFSHKVKLPDWGYEQQEVTCNKNAVRPNSLWYIETSMHEALPPNAPKVNYKLPGFFAKFLELQKVMWTTNAGLTDRHTFDSRPDSWPRLRRGINFWVKDHRQIYLIGNPFVWWLSTFAVALYIAFRGFLILRAQRGYRDFDSTKVVKYDSLCGFLFVGWFLHYFPFFLMGRQLFLHHYFPALYFAVLLSCGVFDLVTSALRPRVRLQIAAVLVVVAVWHFAHFSPLAYGSPWTKTKCVNAKWLKTWDFSCNDFLEDYSQYGNIGFTPQQSAFSAAAPIATTVGGDPGGRPAIVVPDKEAVNPNAVLMQGLDAVDGAGNKPGAKDDGNAGAAKEEHTSIAEGKAEPGRNVFDGVGKDELKSITTGGAKGTEAKVLPTTEKEISAVAGGGTPAVNEKDKEKEKEKTDDVKEKEKMETAATSTSTGSTEDQTTAGDKATTDSTQTKQPSTDTTSTQPPAQNTETDKEEKKKAPVPAGPLAEAELEAQKVANELFPEDADVQK